MAAPHGVKLKDLKCDFTDTAAAQVPQDAQVDFGKHDLFDLDVVKISDALHGSLDPSILSIFQEKTSTESVESEASLLCALTEILDSVDVESLSPFDTLPDAEIFTAQRSSDHTLRNLLLPPQQSSNQHPKISQSAASKSRREVVISDRQLRPRQHSGSQIEISQRDDHEKKNKSHSTRIFRIESEPVFTEDRLELLADLVRHMHPYCMKISSVSKEEDEEEFVDVEAYEEPEENILDQSELGKESKAENAPSFISQDQHKHEDTNAQNTSTKSHKEEMTDRNVKLTTQRSALVRTNVARMKKKKTVTFALKLTSVYEIPAYNDESDTDLAESPSLEDASSKNDITCSKDDVTASEDDIAASKSDITSSKSDNISPQKPRLLSLQEYRLLRLKKRPMDQRRMDYRTKWPSLPDVPRELPDLFKFDPKLSRSAHSAEKLKAANVQMCQSEPKQVKRPARTPAGRTVDPPNPVLVPLKNTQDLMEDRNATQDRAEVQMSDVKPDVCFSCDEVGLSENTPVSVEPKSSAVRSGLSVVMPDAVTEEQTQNTCGEIGIEASDLTSLLEQFETQACDAQTLPEVSPDVTQCRLTDLSSTAGLTPPATPPHQIWRPKGTKNDPIKPSSSKTIQIIEPRPLPSSKTHSKPPLATFTPAINPAQAFLDHDYCGIQAQINSGSCDYRTFSESSHLSASVLLSPDSSPCRMETFEEVESLRGRGLCFSTHPPSPLDHGSMKRRCYEGRYRHSRSSSGSSCSSCSSSSSPSRSRSRSPPRKRYRSRRSGSSSCSRSSSRSSSRSPVRQCVRRRSRSGSRSLCRSRSGSRSPEPDCRWQSRRQKELNRLHEEARRLRQQKAIEERRVVYVGGIRESMAPSDLKDRFSLFGKVEDCTVHLRSHGDNYGFVTYYNTDDAYAAIENGGKLRRPDELPFDICFGGRRQFCKSNYADLDSNRDVDPASRSRLQSFDFDTLLKQAQRGQKR